MAAQYILNLLFDNLSCVSELNGNKLYITIDNKKYRCMFLYRETNPEKNVLFDGNRLEWIYGFIGKIAIDYKEYKGYYVRFHEESLESDINTYDYIVRSPKINILEIVESIPDQEKFPFPKYEEKIDVLPDEEINFSVFENYDLGQYKVIFDLIKMCNSDNNKLSHDDIVRSINLFKEFKYQRMKTIMESSSLYTRESISSCCYLSMQIIKEYPAFKFDWELVTANVNAIYDRDILANPDYPWSLRQIEKERALPSSFLKRRFKEYKPSHYDYDQKQEWELFDLTMTPEECPYDNNDEELNDVNEEEIEEAYKLLQENNPELFVDCSEQYPSIIKQSIIEMIKLNGCFIIDDFIFPDDICDYNSEDDDRNDELKFLQKLEKFNRNNIKEFDENYIRECIEKSKNDDNYTYNTNYRSIMGIDIRSGIVTRQDYENYLLSNKYLYNVEKCIHFKREDLDNFPQFFDKLAKNIKLSLGEITLLDILENPYYDWDINLIIKMLPLYDVFNYFLFYPTLLLLLGYNKNRVDTILIKKQNWLISEFTKREDFSQDYELAFLYPEIKWFSNRLFFTRLPGQLNINNEDNFDMYDQEYNAESIYTWDFLKSLNGILLLDKNCDLSKYSSLSEKEKEMYIFSFLRRNRELFSAFSDIIPNHLITSEMKFKFSAPSVINLNVLMDFIKDKELDFSTGYLLFTYSDDLFFERNFIMLAVKIINYGKSIGENTDFLYLTALKFIEMISTLFSIKKSYNDSHKFYKITDNFTLDEINSSIYANPVAMIKKIVNYKKSNDEDQDFDDSDIKDNSV